MTSPGFKILRLRGSGHPQNGEWQVRRASAHTERNDRTVRGRRMPGWQIALIAVGAPLAAATVAVVPDRALAARKVHAATA
jgi:hypothetical protein